MAVGSRKMTRKWQAAVRQGSFFDGPKESVAADGKKGRQKKSVSDAAAESQTGQFERTFQRSEARG